jgi:hypothetical protein
LTYPSAFESAVPFDPFSLTRGENDFSHFEASRFSPPPRWIAHALLELPAARLVF